MGERKEIKKKLGCNWELDHLYPGEGEDEIDIALFRERFNEFFGEGTEDQDYDRITCKINGTWDSPDWIEVYGYRLENDEEYEKRADRERRAAQKKKSTLEKKIAKQQRELEKAQAKLDELDS